MQGTFALSRRITRHAVEGAHGIVAAQSRLAAEIGAAVLTKGGNAVDAAIATSFALGVIEPWSSGIGGFGCLLARGAGGARAEGVDFGPLAPAGLDPALYPLRQEGGGDLFGWPGVEGDRNLEGPSSWCAPTYLQGLGLAHERLGSLPWAELVAPAVELAEAGLEVDWYTSLLIGTAAQALYRHPTSAARFLKDGFPPAPAWSGESASMPLPELAATLRLVRDEGWRTLLNGTLKGRFLNDVRGLGGVVGEQDILDSMARPVSPLMGAYRKMQVATMPGLFGGVTLQAALRQLETHRLEGDLPDAEAYAAYAEALASGFAERIEALGDLPSDPPDPSCTSHVSVIDAEGGMVALTQTLLSPFGSKVVLPETGILMNNGVMWFDPEPGRPNSLGPRKRPLANMCPVLATGPDANVALGASGGRRILPALLQILSFLTDHFMPLEEALAQPRLDVAADGLVTLDARLPDEVGERLSPHYRLRRLKPLTYPLLFACPTAVLEDRADGRRYGMSEPMHPWADAVAED